jgi:phage/plasmid-like protein (TIGR03299 family)
MPDMVETYAGPVAWWEGISPTVRERTIIDRPMTLDEAFTLGGLDWTVTKRPLFVTGPWPQQVNAACVQRDKDGRTYGPVGTDYVIIQNEVIKTFSKDILDAGEQDIKVKTAGTLFDGAKVWMLLQVNGETYIRGDGRPYEQYLLVRTGHDGKTALGAFSTMENVVCWNTMSAAVEGASNRYTVKHTLNAEFRVGEARKALDLHFKYTETLRETLERLTYADMSVNGAVAFTETLLPVNPQSDNPYKTLEQRAGILALFDHSTTMDGIAPTAYRMYQAVTEYTDHFAPVFKTKRGSAEDRRVDSIIDGSAFALKSRALALLVRA